jgi:hypothetical protein
MSKLVIRDLTFLTELNNQESEIDGGASAGAAAGANYQDAVAAGSSTTDGDVYASAYGSYNYSYYDPYYGGSSSSNSGPSASVSTSGRYWWWY